MTTSEITNLEENRQKEVAYSPEKTLFPWKLIEYLLLAAIVASAIVIILFQENPKFLLAGSISLAASIVLFIINRQALEESQNAVKKYELTKKAELYTYLLTNNSPLEKNTITPARSNALLYCQDLINDYKKTRDLSRNFYYVLQLATVVFSGVTPILVLVDKLEAGQAWLKWLPVICPAIASIVASIVTSFPFQKNWIAANTTVELLEAEQEKFILGITPLYRCYDLSDEAQQQQKASQAVEQFIIQVNNIHLNQLQQSSETQPEKTEAKTESTPANEG